ncbi:MAG: putative sulfate exporter family transporter [Acidobacteria bacterium]|nr:putative sulfate exporter family transporter [Acidobacteriota bacterium]
MSRAIAATPTASSTADEAQQPTPLVNEDWIAVAIGAAIILLVILGLRPAVPRFGWDTPDALSATVLTAENFSKWIQVGLLMLVPAVAGARVMGVPAIPFLLGFAVLYTVAGVAQVLAGFTGSSAVGLEYVIYALVIGLVLGQTTTLRRRLMEAVRAEYYIKVGLVVLGASVLFSELVEAGLLGIAQALLVVISVWSFSFWLARRMRIDEELATMLSSAVSICGVSAAIATCGAIQGDRRKLSYVSSLVLVVAVPMMLVMPWVSRITGMPDAVSGAWLGGTLDTSAAVVAAGELVSDQARNAAVVVKLSQNVLIGVAAFLLTIWWSTRHGSSGEKSSTGIGVIWERFPKFVLGFLAVSLVFSFVISSTAVSDTRSVLTAVRTGWFALAFLSIGLETSFGDLARVGGGRPVVVFLGAQAFNVVVTLVFAYLFFGGILFPVPTFN